MTDFSFFYLQEQKYIRDAENAWQQAWDILQEEKGWSLEAGLEPCKGCVYARKFNKLGKIFRLEVRDKNIHQGIQSHQCLLAGTAKRSAGVAPEICLRELVARTPLLCIRKAAHSGFETQRRRHRKSKTGVSVAPRKGLLSCKN